MTSARDWFAVIGFVTFFGWLADFIWGASMALRGLDPNGVGGIAAAFAYGLLSGGPR